MDPQKCFNGLAEDGSVRESKSDHKRSLNFSENVADPSNAPPASEELVEWKDVSTVTGSIRRRVFVFSAFQNANEKVGRAVKVMSQ